VGKGGGRARGKTGNGGGVGRDAVERWGGRSNTSQKNRAPPHPPNLGKFHLTVTTKSSPTEAFLPEKCAIEEKSSKT